MAPRETVIEVSEVSVEGPLMDGVPTRTTRLGVFSAFTTALEWLGRRFAESRPDETGGLVYYRLDAIVHGADMQITRSMVFGADDRLRGIVDGDDDKPWGGCRPDDCRHKPGDLVGFVSPYEPEYRIGIVLAQPPTPREAGRGQLTVADNRYLVGTLNAEGSRETDGHAHVHRALIFSVEHELSAAFRAALRSRRGRYRQ